MSRDPIGSKDRWAAVIAEVTPLGGGLDLSSTAAKLVGTRHLDGVELLGRDALLVRVRGGQGSVRAVLRELDSLLKPSAALWIAAGSLVSDPGRAEESLDEAKEALRIARRLDLRPKYVGYEDALLAAVVANSPARGRLAEILDPLVEWDNASGAGLLETLTVWLEGDLSLRAASSRLGLHRHTVDNRLRRIVDLLGRDPRKGPDRIVVEMAVLARRLTPGQKEGLRQDRA